MVLQFPGVQTGIARYVSSKLQDSIDGRIEIGAIRIHPFNAVTLTNVTIIDENPRPDNYGRGCGTIDTLAHIGKLSATVSPSSILSKGGIHLGRVDAQDVLLQLAIEPGGEYSTNITRIFRLGGKDKDSTMPLDTLFSIHRLNVRDAHYRMVGLGPNPSSPRHGINFMDLNVRFDVRAHDIGFRGGRMHAVVDKLNLSDKCGYGMYDVSGTCAVGMGHTTIRNLRARDNAGSSLFFPKADFNYEGNPSAWGNFIQDVELDLLITGSHLVFHSISAFSGGVFYQCPLQADIETCRFKGPVSNFRVSDLVFSGTESDVSGTVDCAISGIPKTSQMYIDAVLTNVRFTTAGLQKVLSDVGAQADLSKYAPGTVFTANGTMSGLLGDFKSNLRLGSSIGGLRIDATARGLTVKGKTPEFTANIKGDSFDLGKFLRNKDLGPPTFTARASGSLGKAIRANLESLDISSINYLGYEYSDLALEGRLEGSALQLGFKSSDPNALAGVVANVDWKNKTGRIEAELTDIELATLNIDTRGVESSVSCFITAEQGLQENEPARIFISDLTLRRGEDTYLIGDIVAEARTQDDILTLILNSRAFDAKYYGTTDIAGLISDLRGVTVDRYLPAVFAPGKLQPDEFITRSCSLNAIFHKTDGLLAFLLPGLAVEEGTAINLDLDESGLLLAYLSSPGVSYNNLKANGFDVSLGNIDGSLDCTVAADRFSIGSVPFTRAAFLAGAYSDMLNLSLNYESADVLDGGSELYLDAAFSRDKRDSLGIDISSRPSQINIKGSTWELSESDMRLDSGRAYIDGLLLSCGEQSIYIGGAVSPALSDTLAVSLSEFDLDIVNDFLAEGTPRIKGTLDGDVTLLSPVPSKLGLFAGLDLTGLEIDGHPAGDLRLDSDWDDRNRIMTIGLDNTVDGSKTLSLSGKYGTRDKTVAATATLDYFDLSPVAPYIKKYLAGFGGKISGQLDASGKTSGIKLSSDDLRLDGVCGRVTYTNVWYSLTGTAGIADNTIQFNNIGVRDEYGGIGVLRGSLALGNFKSPRLDARLDMNRLQAIDITDPDSPIRVYGDLAISGNGHVSGPLSGLMVDADVSSAGSGLVNVPLSSSSAASESDLLTFKQPESENPEEISAAPDIPHRSDAGVTVHAKIKVSPDVIANVEIDKQSGHMLSAGGTGDVILDLNTAKQNFNLKGDYLIDKGKYLFNIPGIVSKEFDIKEGSSLKFNGNIKESTLDIKAVHNVKTSLNTLVADTTSVSTRRTVECGLNIGGRIRSPEVSFSINVPDLDPSTQVAVDAALNTEDKVQKQFVALLLFGTFIPEDNAGIVNGNNMIYSNVGEIVAGQLNNILQKLDIPVDFGFGYQQDNVGTDIFDVAVSTQLFNNRLVVGGSLGNRRYSTSKNANGDIVGDLDIELKLDNSGELRFKLFSHSADEYTSSLDFSQRNGLGLSYQKEYNTTREFFRQLFTSRKRKAQEALAEAGKKKKVKVIEVK